MTGTDFFPIDKHPDFLAEQFKRLVGYRPFIAILASPGSVRSFDLFRLHGSSDVHHERFDYPLLGKPSGFNRISSRLCVNNLTFRKDFCHAVRNVYLMFKLRCAGSAGLVAGNAMSIFRRLSAR